MDATNYDKKSPLEPLAYSRLLDLRDNPEWHFRREGPDIQARRVEHYLDELRYGSSPQCKRYLVRTDLGIFDERGVLQKSAKSALGVLAGLSTPECGTWTPAGMHGMSLMLLKSDGRHFQFCASKSVLNWYGMTT